jgi:hypothetical protein
MKKAMVIFSFLVGIVCLVSTNLTIWETLSICLFIYFFFEFLYNLGNKIVIMDLAIIMSLLSCLVMPVIFYHEYTRENHLARLWVKYMPVSSDDYFSFALPATLLMIAGLRVPLGKLNINKNPRIYLDNVKKYLALNPRLGLILIGVGVTSGLLDFLSPASLKQVFYLMDHLTYVGVFYVLYSPNKHKKIIVPSVIALMLGQTIITGMFGEFVFMLACTLVLILLGRKISFQRKLLFAIAGLFLILVFQSIKTDYRKRNWLEGAGADPLYFAELISDRVTDPSTLVDGNRLFFTLVRINQGWLVAVTMKKVPEKFPFAYGETIWQSVAASVVPRFLWPDKPEVGGKYNLKRFWGFDISGYSMNIGPLGEAYGNFGVFGGIIYMFFYGLIFNVILSWILKIAEKRPTIVLWLPFLFFYAISIETDLLTTLGSLIKAGIFTWFVFKIFHIAFRIEL